MAEIKIEQKRGTSVWPWILGITAVALLLWWLATRDDDRAVPATSAVPTAPATVAVSAPLAMPALAA